MVSHGKYIEFSSLRELYIYIFILYIHGLVLLSIHLVLYNNLLVQSFDRLTFTHICGRFANAGLYLYKKNCTKRIQRINLSGSYTKRTNLVPVQKSLPCIYTCTSMYKYALVVFFSFLFFFL